MFIWPTHIEEMLHFRHNIKHLVHTDLGKILVSGEGKLFFSILSETLRWFFKGVVHDGYTFDHHNNTRWALQRRLSFSKSRTSSRLQDVLLLLIILLLLRVLLTTRIIGDSVVPNMSDSACRNVRRTIRLGHWLRRGQLAVL